MSSKWIKVLILMVAVVVLLAVAGCLPAKDGGAEPTGIVPSVVPGTSDSTSAPIAPTDASGSSENGWVNKDGRAYYFINGVLQKDTVVGSDADGYYYVNAEGVRDDGYCNALTVDGVEWNVIEGRASRIENEWDKCLHTALTHVGRCTDSSMTREQKLRAAFEYIKSDDNFLEGVPDRDGEPYYEMNWPVVCANELLVDGMGDCYSYGAAFAFMGKAIGYDECNACTTGGHGWAIIEGKAYDPEWDAHHQEYNHFGVAPEDDCDVSYFDSLTVGVDWMKIDVSDYITK